MSRSGTDQPGKTPAPVANGGTLTTASRTKKQLPLKAPSYTSKLVIGGIVLDDETKQVSVDGEGVSLTPIEYNILLLLPAQ